MLLLGFRMAGKRRRRRWEQPRAQVWLAPTRNVLHCFTVAFVAGCTLEPTPAVINPPPRNGPSRTQLSSDGVRVQAGYDVTVNSDPPESSHMGFQVAAQVFSYHVDKSWTGATWTFSVYPQPTQPTNLPGGVAAARDVGSILTDDNASFLTVASRSGQVLSNSQFPNISAVLNGSPIIRPPSPDTARAFPPAPTPPFPFTQSVREPRPPQALIMSSDEARALYLSGSLGDLVAVAGKAPTQTKMLRSLGVHVGLVNGKARYVSQQGDFEYESLVDPSLGAVIERNMAFRGQLVEHVTLTYRRLADSIYYKSRMVIQLARPGDTQPRSQIEYAISSFHLSGVGGK